MSIINDTIRAQAERGHDSSGLPYSNAASLPVTEGSMLEAPVPPSRRHLLVYNVGSIACLALAVAVWLQFFDGRNHLLAWLQATPPSTTPSAMTESAASAVATPSHLPSPQIQALVDSLIIQRPVLMGSAWVVNINGDYYAERSLVLPNYALELESLSAHEAVFRDPEGAEYVKVFP